ncbi:plastocyanin/azurin family copper-binding protein [Halalkalicoccus sp. NIPERK01]|uniref:cupredoxin domain-containing protein n=1 Tax=Halalkalicoccus sp. NIPERK01 TaxID=3053469 RepID=UPI00256F357E|nr:plastocyanin/azurin family copper-binding protein [Halalkalicoccus sp. NIPERK01]
MNGTALIGSITLLSGCLDGSGSGGDGGGGSDGGDSGENGGGSGGGGDDEGGDDGEAGNGGANGGETRTIRLGGATDGWQGQEPSDIADQTNPSLALQAGTTYELTWENLDGAEHELIIEDAEGTELEASDSSEEQGETVTLTFDAAEGMAAYYCEYHPEAMRGEITLE